MRMFYQIINNKNGRNLILQMSLSTEQMNSRQKYLPLLPIFKETFLKSTLPDSQVCTLLSHAEFIESDIDAIIFDQGNPIDHYYFLIRGMVGLYRSKSRQEITGTTLVNDTDFVSMIQGTKVVGEYFYNAHSLRECTAIVKENSTEMVRVEKKIFHAMCQVLVTQYNQIQNYARDRLQVGKKTNCFEIFNFRNYRLGSSIKLTSELGFIIKGECKILTATNFKPTPQNSPHKRQLPPIFRPNIKSIKHEVALINENEWVFTENLEQNQNNQESKFKYVVSSSSLCLLILPVSNINVLPPQRLTMLMKIHQERNLRVSYQQRLSCRPSQQRELSNSPGGRKQRKLDQAQKILEKLDPNLSPNMMLKKYKLGYNSIRFENYERKERNSVISEVEIMQKQKTDRKLKKYYEARDWSQYIKIPNPRP